MSNSHPTFTLHHGANQATFEEHPIETARKALLAAADLENEDWAAIMRRFASVLPNRGAVRRPTPDPFARRERVRPAWQDDEWREIEDVWKRTPTERRESLLLQVLGSERLLIRELMLRVNTELLGAEGKGPYGKHRAVYESNIRSLVMRMLRDGQLERTPETLRNKTRYRYSQPQ